MVNATNPFARSETKDESTALVGTEEPSGDPWGMPNMDASDDDFEIDLSGVTQSKRQDFIGLGRHLGFISDVERRVSKAGNPMVVFSATVYRGEYAGKTRAVYCALTENALWKLDQTLQALGIEQGTERKLKFSEIKNQAMRTMCVLNVVDAGEYEGRPQTQLDGVEAPVEFGLEAGAKMPEAGQPGI